MLNRKLVRGLATAVAALTVSAIMAITAIGSTPPIKSPPSAAAGRTEVMGMHLTHQQEAALVNYLKSHRAVSRSTARFVIEHALASKNTITLDGYGSSSGPCGIASLATYGGGAYQLRLRWAVSDVGYPVAGNVNVFSDGISSIDAYNVASSAIYNFYSGTLWLSPVGGGNVIIADGWAVTSDGWFCGIWVSASI